MMSRLLYRRGLSHASSSMNRLRCMRLSSGATGRANARTSRRRWLTRVAVATALGLPAAKIVYACLPLWVDNPGLVQVWEPQVSVGRDETVSVAWVISHGSDRLVRVMAVAIATVLDYWRVYRSGASDWSDVHQRGADRILRLCEVNKGIYIKLGQHVAQMQYLLPLEYVTTLKAMLREAPQSSIDTVREVIRFEMGAAPEEVFAEFDPEPLASASLAQVHRARLRSGEEVAVKVQHAGLHESSQVDIRIIQGLIDIVCWMFPKFQYRWFVDEVSHNIPLELDFMHERKNMRRCEDNLADRPGVRVPSVFDGLSGKRVLTMEFCHGVHIDDLEGLERIGADPREVITTVTEVFSEQIYLKGFVHCDPHAGNVLVSRNSATGMTDIILLDHGLYRELSDEFRWDYCHLWRSLIFADEQGIKEYARRLNAGDMYRVFASILTFRKWNDIMDPSLDSLQLDTSRRGRIKTRAHASQLIDDISEILSRVPRDLLLLLKTNDNLRAVSASLGNPVNTQTIIARYCVEGVKQQRNVLHPGIYSTVANAVDAVALEASLGAFAVMSCWSGGKRKQSESE